MERLTSAGGPDADTLVISSGNNLAAVGRELDPVDGARVSFENLLRGPVGGPPNANGLILTGGGHPGPVGGIRDAEGHGFVAFERRDHPLIFQPDDYDVALGASRESCGQQPLAVGRNGKNIRPTGESLNRQFRASILLDRPEIEASSRVTNQVTHPREIDRRSELPSRGQRFHRSLKGILDDTPLENELRGFSYISLTAVAEHLSAGANKNIEVVQKIGAHYVEVGDVLYMRFQDTFDLLLLQVEQHHGARAGDRQGTPVRGESGLDR